MALSCKEIIYGPGDVIFKKNDIDTRLLYIVKGEIEFFVDSSDGKFNKILGEL